MLALRCSTCWPDAASTRTLWATANTSRPSSAPGARVRRPAREQKG
jgi:hypothetical protein